MHAAARCFNNIDKTAHHGLIIIDPSQGDINMAGTPDHFSMEITLSIYPLGFLLICAVTLNMPDIAYRFAMRQVIHEIDDPAFMEEFLDPGMAGDRSLSYIHAFYYS